MLSWNVLLAFFYRWHELFGYTTCAKSRSYWTPYFSYWEKSKVKLPDCICIITHWCQSAALSALNTLQVSWHHYHCNQLTNKRINHVTQFNTSDVVVTPIIMTAFLFRFIFILFLLHIFLSIKVIVMSITYGHCFSFPLSGVAHAIVG